MSPKLIRILLCLCVPFAAAAQNSNKENIPYSRYGVGDPLNGLNVSFRAMGGLSAASSSGTAVNTENPATYTTLSLATYELAGMARSTNLYSGNQSYSTGGATLSYINIGFPVGKHGGVAFGIKPYSKVYYRLISDSTLSSPALGNVSYVYSGDGGLNYAYVGGAFRYGHISIGANAGYLFGTIRNSSVLQQNDTFKTLSSEFTQYNKIGGIYWQGGLFYRTDLSKRLELKLGGTVRISQTIGITQDFYQLNARSLNSATVIDTASHTTSIKDRLVLPMTTTFGAQLSGDARYTVGADATITNWSQFSRPGSTDSLASQTFRLSVGAEIIPNILSLNNYFARIGYKIGGWYGSDYVKLRNETMYNYALTFGLSFPFRRTTDRLHTAVEVGRRGTQSKGLIEEHFVRFSLGISLNDRWFVKRRYD